MGKLLLLLLVALAAYLFWRGTRGGASGRGGAAGGDGERMVDCSECGVHLPVSEAIRARDRYFCCEEHQRSFGR